jgi:anti-sigma factor RsiW
MSHRIQHQLSAYLDGELPPTEMADVRQHLTECEECRQEVEELRATRDLVRRLQTPPVPADFASSLWDRIERDEPRRAFSIFGWVPRPALALAAVLLTVILLGVPLVKGRLDRLRASETGPEVFVRSYAPVAAEDPFADRAMLVLVHSDAGLKLIGEDPRGTTGSRGEAP